MSTKTCYHTAMRVFIQPLIAISNIKLLLIVFLLLSFLFSLYFETLFGCVVSAASIGFIVITSMHFGVYLSEIIINENDIVLVRKKIWEKSYIQIYKSDISSFHVELKGRGIKNSCLSECETVITIQTINKKLYHFYVEPVINLKFCDYEIFFKILDASFALPNFSESLDIARNGAMYIAVKSRLKNQKRKLKSRYRKN